MESRLISISSLNIDNTIYYKINFQRDQIKSVSSKLDTEISKYKRTTISNHESLLRQLKLLQSIKNSGEEDKLISLIDKWEGVIKDVIRELFVLTGEKSMQKFVKKLGLEWEDLGFSDVSEEEEEEEEEEDFKRIKYDD